MSFFDQVSKALGTDGSHSGLNLQGFYDSVSNALGTDGSKNGLLNDPYSQAALALAGGAYFGYIPLGGSGSVGGAVAATEGATTAAASYSAGAAVADSAVAATAASSASALPSWLTLSNVATGASIASKVLGGSAPRAQGASVYSPGYYTVNNVQQPNRQQPGTQIVQAGDSGLSLVLLAVAAILLLR